MEQSRRHFLTGGALLAVTGFAAGPAARAQEPGAPVQTGFLNRTVSLDGETYRYVVYVPWSFARGQKLPVILFLHGAGERGADGLKPSQVGLGTALRMYSERYPAIGVMPQCRTGERWDGVQAQQALKALDQTLTEYGCDPDRQYLTGLSMGGYGSWLLASKYPERFAAVVPVCGGGEPSAMAPRLKEVAVWAFHGDADTAVPVDRSRQMVEAIKAAGGTKIRYTEYPGVPHNSWDKAYSDAEMAAWMFSRRRGG